MFNPFKFFTMPEYFYHPRHALRRFRRMWHTERPTEVVRLPWGAELMVHTGETIGHGLYYYGIFDKVVPEAIERLLDSGELGIEIGANIGQNCSLMARKAGPSGRVLAFEPHPEIVVELRHNAERWKRSCFSAVRIEPVALGDIRGDAFLDIRPEFATNRGIAALRSEATSGASAVKVGIAKLDDYLGEQDQVGVCKIDVEGHELEVLNGASAALQRRSIRDIVFEDFGAQPSPVTSLLRNHGYEVWRLDHGWLRPRLSAVDAPVLDNQLGHNYLATLDSPRTRARYRPLGWRCLMYL